MRRIQRMRLVCLLLTVILAAGLLPARAQAAENSAGKFILVAEAGGKLVIAPEYVSYTSGQSVGEALEASGHVFTGMGTGLVTAIDGVTGNYTRSDQNGSYDLTIAASSVTHYCFSERSSSESKPSEGMKQLMTAMAEYLTKDEDVRMAAKAAYTEAYTAFVGVSSDDARTLAYELNTAVSEYEEMVNGKKYAVTFRDGSKVYSGSDYPGVTITADNAYGRHWEDDGDGTLELPQGSYTFRIAHDGLSVSGTIAVSGDAAVEAELPREQWLKLDAFRLSGSYGEDSNEDHRFTDAEFTLGQWENRKTTVPVLDSFVGTVYAYAEYDQQLLDKTPTLTAVYTMKNAAGDAMEKELPFESLTSGAYSVLARGAEGNTVIYRVTSEGSDGFSYSQDYTVTFLRIPTLTAIAVADQDGVDQAATTAFDGTVTEYTYKVLDTVSSVRISAVPLVEGYQITVNGQSAADGADVAINGETVVEIRVSANGYDNTYRLTVQPGEGRTLSFISDKEVTVEVVNSNDVVMPYTTHKETDTKNRYKYTLVPGERYRYVATNRSYYHLADEFSLEEVANSIIEISFEDMGDWLTELAFGTAKAAKYKDTLPLNTAFSGANHSYQVSAPDTQHNVYIWTVGDTDAQIQALYSQLFSSEIYHGKELQVELDSGLSTGVKLDRFLMRENPVENTVTVRLTQEINGVTCYQDYEVEFLRELTLKNMTAKCDGTATVLLQPDGTAGFVPEQKEYSVKVSMAASTLTLDVERYTEELCYGEEEIGYRVAVNGTDVTDTGSAVISLDGTMNTQYASITVTNPKAPEGTATYVVNILKSPPVETSFRITPEGALLNIREVMSGERIWPDDKGNFQLCEGYSYDYALTEYGYVSRSGTLTVTRNASEQLVIQDGGEEHTVTEQDGGGAVTISWDLAKAAVNSAINTGIPSEWPNFRGSNSNNAVTDAPIPVSAEAGTLYWANKIGEGYDSDAVGSPILVNGDIITYAGNSLFRVDTVTGEILAVGTMDHKSSFSITPPTYANGMVFVALSNGCVQAFNADTLESLWIYHDPLGGQPNCPLTVKNGYLYTGFWNSETGDARFVCLSVTDEKPGNAAEEKCASWFYTAKGGFYWAGAYVGSDFVLVGTDDGDNGCSERTSRMLLLDAETGRLLDSWDNLHGDIRSTVVYDSETNAYYFTAKGGTFYSMQVSSDRKITGKWSVDLQNGAGGIPMSTCSPSVHNGRAYIGVSGSSQFGSYSGHNITVIDLSSKAIAYSVPTQGYPQTSGLLTTAYEAESGYAYVYFFDNYTPGKLRVLRDRAGQSGADYVTAENGGSTAYALFTPTGDQAQYAICSPIVDYYGTVYFKNDSGHLMAFGSAVERLEITQMPSKTTYTAGEKFDPSGMVVTAVLANGLTRDVTPYVSYSQAELTEQDRNFTVAFTHVLYHNQEEGQEMLSGISTTIPNVTIELTIGEGILGDADNNGSIEQADAQMILDYEAQLLEKEPVLSAADVSGDGKVDSNDAVLILQYLDQKIERFPAEEETETE